MSNFTSYKSYAEVLLNWEHVNAYDSVLFKSAFSNLLSFEKNAILNFLLILHCILLLRRW